MHKLTLDLDALDVQSFDPTPSTDGTRGTVKAHGSFGCTYHDLMCPSMYNEASTCQVSDLGTCNVTCGNSCPATCRNEQSCVTCYEKACEEPY